MTWKQDERERLLRILAGATFLIFFQAYMVAPLIPRLAAIFSVSEERIGLIVPAYMIPLRHRDPFLWGAGGSYWPKARSAGLAHSIYRADRPHCDRAD